MGFILSYKLGNYFLRNYSYNNTLCLSTLKHKFSDVSNYSPQNYIFSTEYSNLRKYRTQIKDTLSPSLVRCKAHSVNNTINWGLEIEPTQQSREIKRLQREHWNFVLTPKGWPFNHGHQIKLTHLLSKWGDSIRVTNSITYVCQCPWSCYPNLLYGKQRIPINYKMYIGKYRARNWSRTYRD